MISNRCYCEKRNEQNDVELLLFRWEEKIYMFVWDFCA